MSVLALILPPLLALLIAGFVAMVELVTIKYPRTFFALTMRQCPSLYIYCFIYGLAGLLIMLFLPPDRMGLHNPLVEALFVGVSVKALLSINFYSVPVPGNTKETIPVGPKFVVHLLESWLLERIDDDENAGVYSFLEKRAGKYTDPRLVRKRILEGLPRRITEDQNKLAPFRRDLELKLRGDPPDPSDPPNPSDPPDHTGKVKEAMKLYLYNMGRKNFDQIFPDR